MDLLAYMLFFTYDKTTSLEFLSYCWICILVAVESQTCKDGDLSLAKLKVRTLWW